MSPSLLPSPTSPSLIVQPVNMTDTYVVSQLMRTALEPYYLPYNKQIPSMPATLVSGQFLATSLDDARHTLLHTGAKNKIYVTIALSTCNRATGMYSLLKKSHHDKNPRITPVSEWEQEDIALNPGDALIWRGDVSYMMSAGGGGKWVCSLAGHSLSTRC